MRPLFALDVVEAFVGGIFDGEDRIEVVVAGTTTDLFSVGDVGWLIIRQTPKFDLDEWQQVCAYLPAGTTIDPDEWEPCLGDTEMLFVPEKN